jgi:uncharacterized protein YaiI (UPF0178 family)/RimJ/RimL family protein N-acetyltransferase
MDLDAALAHAAARTSLAVLRTERLVLRPWREDDKPAWAELNADPAVVAHLPGPLTREQSDAMIERFRLDAARRGFGVWALERREDRQFLGAVGLHLVSFEAPFTPAVEVMWRLAHAAWGHGYATEGARAALRFAFEQLRLPRVTSFTVPANVRSWAVMERIGMVRSGTFEHPALPEGHPLRTHVLYTLDAPAEPVAAPISPPVAPIAEPSAPLPRVWIDGDGCPRPVKETVYKAAQRGACEVVLIANHEVAVPRSVRIRTLVVKKGLDVADDALVAQARAGELVITSDVPLAAELVPNGVVVLSPRGEWSTASNIGEKLSLRDFFTEARASGMVEGGGPPPYDERAKKAFADALQGWLDRRRRELTRA